MQHLEILVADFETSTFEFPTELFTEGDVKVVGTVNRWVVWDL